MKSSKLSRAQWSPKNNTHAENVHWFSFMPCVPRERNPFVQGFVNDRECVSECGQSYHLNLCVCVWDVRCTL